MKHAKLKAEHSHTECQRLLLWVDMAWNSLKMWNGLNSHQLEFGQNPNFPGNLKDTVPALKGTTSNEILASMLTLCSKQKKAFIETEVSECIKIAYKTQTI